MPRPFVKAVALSGAVAASALFAFSANAAQVLTPKHVSGAAGVATGTVIASQNLSVAKGRYITFDVAYSVTLPNSKDESGLGLKLLYDSNFFDEMTPDTLTDATPPALVTQGSYRTDITNLLAKCMIASPSPQTPVVGASGREVVFGWIDTSIRGGSIAGATGAVGWPGSDDPAAPGSQLGCLNPGGPGGVPAGINTQSAGTGPIPPEVKLFLISTMPQRVAIY